MKDGTYVIIKCADNAHVFENTVMRKHGLDWHFTDVENEIYAITELGHSGPYRLDESKLLATPVRYLSSVQSAAYLGLGKTTFYQLVKKEKIPVVHIGRKRYDIIDLDRVAQRLKSY